MPSDPRGLAPVDYIEPDRQHPDSVEDGIALCLSGGGYRAMLFHVGALWRLNELGYLPRLRRVSSVSGGSITAGVLGMHWRDLQFDANGVGQQFARHLVDPIRKLAGVTIDGSSVVLGLSSSGSIADKIASAYKLHLFGSKTLQDLPTDPGEGPRFVINATNVQSGALWRFSKPFAADWRVGRIAKPAIELAVAVSASSAFPPFLSPAHLTFDPGVCQRQEGNDLHFPPYTTNIELTDGGVYDNLGLETAWKRYRTVLVSDGGGRMEPNPDPADNWAQHSKRVLDLIDHQVRNLRKRQLITSYQLPVGHSYHRDGAYWGIRTNVADYGLDTALPYPHVSSLELARIPTRLKALAKDIQERLINWGYVVCDAAIRRHVAGNTPAKPRWPYPDQQPRSTATQPAMAAPAITHATGTNEYSDASLGGPLGQLLSDLDKLSDSTRSPYESALHRQLLQLNATSSVSLLDALHPHIKIAPEASDTTRVQCTKTDCPNKRM